MAVAHRVGDPVHTPEEIDVLEENGKTIHILLLQVRVDVTEYKDRQEILDATHITMAETIKTQAAILEEKWRSGKK